MIRSHMISATPETVYRVLSVHFDESILMYVLINIQ